MRGQVLRHLDVDEDDHIAPSASEHREPFAPQSELGLGLGPRGILSGGLAGHRRDPNLAAEHGRGRRRSSSRCDASRPFPPEPCVGLEHHLDDTGRPAAVRRGGAALAREPED